MYSRLLNHCQISLVQFGGYLNGARVDAAWLMREFNCRFIPANADKSPYAIDSDSASCAVSFELLEHLQGDPMHLVQEVNRGLSPGGTFYISTPNVLYSHNLIVFLFGSHPFSWSVFTDGYGDRHNREYTPYELSMLLDAGGFSVDQLATLTFEPRGSPIKRIAGAALCLIPVVLGRVPMRYRAACAHVRGRKVGPVRDRYPKFLYDLYGNNRVKH
jgi:SAM-dependent methyltransferase